MTKSTTDELVEQLNVTKPKKKAKSNKTEVIKKWLLKEVWNGRPINWLAIGLSYGAIAYTSYMLATYFVRVPEFVGIVAFAVTLAVGSRAFKK